MDKRSCLINNRTRLDIKISDLGIAIPPGSSNLFELDSNLDYEMISNSMRQGALYAAMEHKLCYLVPDIMQKSLSSDITIREPSRIMIVPNRARLSSVVVDEVSIFDEDEDGDLFEDEDVKPARQIVEELRQEEMSNQRVEATVKSVNLPEKPIENRYAPAVIKEAQAQQKIKNDIAMGYETCHGLTGDGRLCMRRAKTKKRYCGLHKDQGKPAK